jgi:hypothetical protein
MADILLPDLNHFVAPLIYDDLREEIKASINSKIVTHRYFLKTIFVTALAINCCC